MVPLPRAQASRRCETPKRRSAANRQAPLQVRSLDHFRALSGNLTAGDGTKNSLPLRQTTQQKNNRLKKKPHTSQCELNSVAKAVDDHGKGMHHSEPEVADTGNRRRCHAGGEAPEYWNLATPTAAGRAPIAGTRSAGFGKLLALERLRERHQRVLIACSPR